MTNSLRKARNPGRLIAIVAVAILLVIAFGSNYSHVEAKGDRIAVFGTAVDAPSDGTLVVVTRDGVITLVINNKTKIGKNKGS
jgi:hypothetical protein